jgi:hypothetical protein
MPERARKKLSRREYINNIGLDPAFQRGFGRLIHQKNQQIPRRY